MFSKELEDLIQATLEDGVLEEYEKSALVKRAQAEGVDLTELEIYINSLLQKRKKEHNEKMNALEEKREKEKREAFGRICPNCGKQLPPLTIKCDCGYELDNKKIASSVQIFLDKLNKIKNRKLKGRFGQDVYWESFLKQQDEMISVIQLFPVPNSKEDIIEFLALSAPYSKRKEGFKNTKMGRFLTNSEVLVHILFIPFLLIGLFLLIEDWKYMDLDPVVAQNKMAEIWRSKFEQVLIKGRSLRGDPEFTQMLDYYENQLKGNAGA